jgi:hypothetical protein
MPVFFAVRRPAVQCLLWVACVTSTGAWAQYRPEVATQIGANRDILRETEIKAATEESLRPQIATPLMAAQRLMQDQQPGPAAEKIAGAERVTNKSGYERHVIARVKTGLAAQTGDAAQAAQSYDLASNGKWWPIAEKAAMTQTIAGLFYDAKQYSQAAAWYERYAQLAGPTPATELMRAQSHYLLTDFDSAAKVLEPMVQKVIADGQSPSEISLRLLADARNKTGDSAGYQRATDLLARYYPIKAP